MKRGTCSHCPVLPDRRKMGLRNKKDLILKDYMSDTQHFCDFMNGALFSGRSIITPEGLSAEPTELIKIVYRKFLLLPGRPVMHRELNPQGDHFLAEPAQEPGKIYMEQYAEKTQEAETDVESQGEADTDQEGEEIASLTQRFRDLTRKFEIGTGHIILAVQNQSTVDYEMPLRVMLEDAMDYDAQRRTSKTGGMHGKRKLMPVITVVFYHGSGNWNRPQGLTDLLELPEKEVGFTKYIQNYGLTLITPDNVNTSHFKGGWKEVLEILKRQNNEKEMEEYLTANREQLLALPLDTKRLLLALTDMFQYSEGEKMENTDLVCKAFRDHHKTGVRQGKIEGILELLQELGEIPEDVRQKITNQKEGEILSVWLKAAAKAGSIEEFCRAVF